MSKLGFPDDSSITHFWRMLLLGDLLRIRP